MKPDTQHLDYLLSQYVDGCLDPASRKSLEQTLVNDPEARKLYKDHRDVQDVLDDWGSRLPLINWDQFNEKLAGRLEHETVGGQGRSRFKRWARPLSAAAALFVAACIGAALHAWSTPAAPISSAYNTVSATSVRSADVRIEDHPSVKTASFAAVRIEEPDALRTTAAAPVDVDVSSPDDVASLNSLQNAIRYGLGVDIKRPGSATAFRTPANNDKDADKDSKDSEPVIPYP